MGSRTPDNTAAAAWAAGSGGTHASFRDAAEGADLVVLATKGDAVLDVVDAVGAEALDGVVVLDVTNPLDFSHGFPPTVSHPGGLSMGERIQARLPHARVVKALNTMTAAVMVAPTGLAEPTAVFLAGDDDAAKDTVRTLLEQFGWTREGIVDLGDITAARATEAYLSLWLRLMQVQGSPMFNVRVVR
jgi:predicted dinucleotide-binding enzyme